MVWAIEVASVIELSEASGRGAAPPTIDTIVTGMLITRAFSFALASFTSTKSKYLPTNNVLRAENQKMCKAGVSLKYCFLGRRGRQLETFVGVWVHLRAQQSQE